MDWKGKLGRCVSGSQRSFGLLMAFLLAVCLVPLIVFENEPVQASPDTVELWVNTYDGSKTGWTTVGDEPYLNAQDEPSHYVYAGAKAVEIGDFGFSDLPGGAESINSVTLYIYGDYDTESVDVYVWDGSAWSSPYNFFGDGYSWQNVDVISFLDTVAKVNTAKIYLAAKTIGGWKNYVYADAAYLHVDYSAVGNPGWLDSWDYRKVNPINGTTAGAQTNYQMKMTVHYGSGTDNTTDVFLDGKCRTDFGDIRWTESDGTTLMDYWIELLVSEDYAIFWIEIPSIPESPSTIDIYIYYGKSDAASVSNGTNTFIVFDDFEWGNDEDDIDTSGGSVTWSKGIGGTATAKIDTSQSYSGTTSLRLYRDGTNSPSAWFTQVAGTNYAIKLMLRKEDTSRYVIYHGNGTRKVCMYVDSAEDIRWYDSSPKDTGADATADVWQSYELTDINHAANAYDIWFQETKVQDDAAMNTSGTDSAVVRFCDEEGTSNLWIDDVIVRKYASPEPTWGTWGDEETSAVEYERPVAQGFSLTESAPRGAEFGHVIEQGFSFGAVVAIAMEICKLLSQAFGLTGAVGVTFGWGKSLAQDFSLDGSVEANREFGRNIAQDFSLDEEVSANMERWGSIDQTFSIDGIVSRDLEAGRNIVQSFSLGATVTSVSEFAVALVQSFSFSATATGPAGFVRDLSGSLSFAATLEPQYEYGRSLSEDFSLDATVDVDIQRVIREFERDVAQSFSISDAVIIPHYGDIYVTSPWCDNRVNPIDVTDPTPGFSVVYTVTDNDVPNSAMFIQIQVGTSWDDNDLWDNIAAVTVENGQRSLDVSYGGTPLTLNALYWWRCRFGDSNSNLTEWTPPQTFGYQGAPFDLVAAAMFIFPIVLMAIAFIFDNVVFASFAGVVFILSGLFFIDTLDTIWLGMVFVGVGVYLLIIAALSEEDEG